MQKKITSSLVIAACCLNSLPVFAGPLPASAEEALNILSKGVKAYGTPKERMEFMRRLECNAGEELLSSLHARRFGNNSTGVSYINLLSTLHLVPGSGKSITGHFIGSDLPSKDVAASAKSLGAISDLMSPDSEKPGCALYKKNRHQLTEFKYDKTISISRIMDNLKSDVNILIFRLIKSNKDKKIKKMYSKNIDKNSENIDKNLSYSYVRILPDKLAGNVSGSILSEIGGFELSYSEFQNATAGLSENFVAASHDSIQNETTFFLLTKEGCFPLKKLTGTAFGDIGTVRNEFLKDIFSEKPVSFLGETECPFEDDLKNIFNASSLRAHTETGTDYNPFEHLLAPDPEATVNPFTFYDNSFLNSTPASLPSFNESRNDTLPIQASHAASNNYFNYIVGGSALAAGIGIGAIVYRYWMGEKRKGRNVEYDAAVQKADIEQ